jgi:arginine N-succinyltransferase
MVIVRPVAMADLDQLVELAETASFGLTNLPKDRELLVRRIDHSELSFARTWNKPRGELYMFVMKDLETGGIIGTSSIVSKVGGFEPFWAYKMEISIHESKLLQVRKEVPTLHLLAEHSGPCEIGGLYLDPAHRRHGNGRLLSLFRFLFMKEYPECFEPLVIAEMRGVMDDEGRSPFWEAVGRHFFDMDYPKADYLTIKDKRFIADLMPRHPIYVPLLPPAAQEVIGKVHHNTRPALKMLMDEGFTVTGMVDIFEAGPVISCTVEEIRIVKESTSAPLVDTTPERPESEDFIIIKTEGGFRACVGKVGRTPDGGVALHTSTAQALRVGTGQTVRFGPLRPSPHAKG